jgi:hypothetical protein
MDSTGNRQHDRKLSGWAAIGFFVASIVGPFGGVAWWLCAVWFLGGLYMAYNWRKLRGQDG